MRVTCIQTTIQFVGWQFSIYRNGYIVFIGICCFFSALEHKWNNDIVSQQPTTNPTKLSIIFHGNELNFQFYLLASVWQWLKWLFFYFQEFVTVDVGKIFISVSIGRTIRIALFTFICGYHCIAIWPMRSTGKLIKEEPQIRPYLIECKSSEVNWACVYTVSVCAVPVLVARQNTKYYYITLL